MTWLESSAGTPQWEQKLQVVEWPFDIKPDFVWSENDLSVKEFEEIGTLPVIINVRGGFLGLTEMHTFGGDETYLMIGKQVQKRFVVKDSNNRYISIPEDHPTEFQVFHEDMTVSQPMTLTKVRSDFERRHPKESFPSLKYPILMKFAEKPGVVLSMLSDESITNFGGLKLISNYEEKYLYGYSIVKGDILMCQHPIIMPVYLPITISKALGIRGLDSAAWKRVFQHFLRSIIPVDHVNLTECQDIIVLSQDGAPDVPEDEYQYIHPRNLIVPTIGRAIGKKSAKDMLLPPTPMTVSNIYSKPVIKETTERLPPKAPPNPKKGKPLPPLPATSSEQQEERKTSDCYNASGSRPTTHSPGARQHSTVPRNHGNPEQSSSSHHNEGVYGSIYELPKAMSTYTVTDVSETLRLLNMEEYVHRFREEQVDGTLLAEMDLSILQDDMKMKRFHAVKLINFVKSNWRPKLANTKE